MTLRLSASAMGSFFSCPAKFLYGTQYTPLEEPIAIRDGVAAHAILAGEPVESPSARARGFAARARELYETAGYRPLLIDGKSIREIRQTVWLSKTTPFTRIIDHIAINPEGKVVIVDWKTGTWPWYFEDVTPQAMTFQAVAYTMPPVAKEDWLGLEEWPDQIDFFSLPEKGDSIVHSYSPTDEDFDNMMMAVRMMQDAAKKGNFPKVRGYHCNTGKTKCPFFDVCYNIPGWETKYDRR